MKYYKDHLSRLRAVELEVAFPGIPADKRVLEIGGGNGFQAFLLSTAGYGVESIDVETTNSKGRSFFPVRPYDGVHIPFPDASFDVIFSSNVLEHVRQLPALLEEMQRVLRPGGCAIHVLPSPIWRIFTIMAHYPNMVRRVFGRRRVDGIIVEAPIGDIVRRRGWIGTIREAIIPGPHGVFKNSLVEVLEYRKRSWKARFKKANWDTVETRPAGIFYTGYCLFPQIPIWMRIGLSRLLGSACTIYVCRPRK